jgi:hypothetical protein
MKPIDNYINERLNPRHLGKKMNKFPIDGTIDDIKVFLKNNGFNEIEDDTERIGDSIDFYNEKTPDKYFSFVYDDNNKNNKIDGIEFIDRTEGEISNENKLYYISFDRGKLYFTGFFKRGGNALCEDFEKDEFLEEINKVFGWE